MSIFLKMFARRALSKINELHELELASINGEKGAQALEFREATIKVCKLEQFLHFSSLYFKFDYRLALYFSKDLYSKAGVKPKDF
jgi:hypothetical protein